MLDLFSVDLGPTDESWEERGGHDMKRDSPRIVAACAQNATTVGHSSQGSQAAVRRVHAKGLHGAAWVWFKPCFFAGGYFLLLWNALESGLSVGVL